MADLSSSAVKEMATDFDYSVEEEDDACSICLEPFSCSDPSAVTSCKHEYHLQCILEWSQRSKECPICWRLLVLKDPGSQELLEAVEIERNSRSRQRSSTSSSMFARASPEHYDFEPVPYALESELDEHIMEHLRTAVLGRARHFGRRQRHCRSPGLDQFLAFSEPSDDSDLQEMPVGSQSSGNPSTPESDSERSIDSASVHNQSSPHNLTSYTGPNVTHIQQSPSRPRGTASQTSPRSPRSSRPSEVLSFSENLKSKFAAASARYKESITKSTRGLKEKLLARNNSVKELSKEVQREVTASIAGVARMMERLDPNIKNSGSSSPLSTDVVGTSNLSYNGKGVQGSRITPSPNGMHLETAHGASSHSPIPSPGGLSSV
ncbi:RING-type E3 ubiquitin transferase [Ranunculus cassubicifolius]